MANNIVFMSAGVGTDGGGIIITVENGKLVIKRIPPWEPMIMKEILAASNMLSLAASVKDKSVAQQLQRSAEGVINARSSELQAYMKQLG